MAHRTAKTKNWIQDSGLKGVINTAVGGMSKSADKIIKCSICNRTISVLKFASHLEKCMGHGRSRSCRRRTTSTSSQPVSTPDLLLESPAGDETPNTPMFNHSPYDGSYTPASPFIVEASPSFSALPSPTGWEEVGGGGGGGLVVKAFDQDRMVIRLTRVRDSQTDGGRPVVQPLSRARKVKGEFWQGKLPDELPTHSTMGGYPYAFAYEDLHHCKNAAAPSIQQLKDMLRKVCGVAGHSTNKMCGNKRQNCKQHTNEQRAQIREEVIKRGTVAVRFRKVKY